MEPDHAFRRRELGIGIGAIAVFLLVLVAWYGYLEYEKQRIPAEYSNEFTPFQALVEENAAFSSANQLFDSRRYAEARKKYQEALVFATDDIQEAQIEFKIALSSEMLKEYALAVQQYKILAADTGKYAYVRAYAAQRIGLMFYSYGYTHPEIKAETFKGEPFQSFLADGADDLLAYRRIFDYASAIRPLAIAEMRSADWYANEVLKLAKDDAKRSEYIEIIRTKIANADADIARIQGDTNARGDIPIALLRKGEILGKLATIGEATFDEAESAFKVAMQLNAAYGNRGVDGYTLFHYASFLERYTQGREEDIRSILAPLYRDPLYAGTPVMDFFGSQRNTTIWPHASLSGMAEVDPDFKSLLVSLGWTEGDFQ